MSALPSATPPHCMLLRRAWSVDGTVAPLSLFDSVGDLMPAVQLDDMAAQLKAVGARNYQAATVPGNGHSFDYWPQVKNSALAFLGSVLNGRRP